MRGTWCACAMGLILVVTESSALAQEDKEGFVESFSNFFRPNWQEDLSVSVGAKVWMNEWTRDSFIRSGESLQIPVTGGSIGIDVSTRDTAPDTFISGIEPTPIPQATISYKRLLIVGSYYPETEFDFPTTELTTTSTVSSGGSAVNLIRTTRFETTAEREEWDVGLGVTILDPYLAILGGYKEIDQKLTLFQLTTTTTPPSSSSRTANARIKLNGPIIGISGSAPFGKTDFGLYASYAHGFMDADITDPGEPTATRDAAYDVMEFAFIYAPGIKRWLPQMPLSGTTLFAGYRYQNIETEIPNAGDRTDTTRGFIAGLNLHW
jgi:hypothetical protein